jgi:alpha-glucosidase
VGHWFQCTNKCDAEELAQAFNQYQAKIPYKLAQVQFNFLDSHDIERLHTIPELSFESYRGAVIILFTYPGTPSIYYGDEIGLIGHRHTVEGCRYSMEWDQKKHNSEHYQLYQKLIDLKENEVALQQGGFKIIYAQDQVFSFARFTREKAYLVVSSQEKEKVQVELPVAVVVILKVLKLKKCLIKK